METGYKDLKLKIGSSALVNGIGIAIPGMFKERTEKALVYTSSNDLYKGRSSCAN